MNKKTLPTLLLSTTLCLYNIPVFGAEDAVNDASIVTYEKEYFAKLSPVTLLDMLQSVPGVSEILTKNRQQSRQSNRGGGGGQRGFGSGGDQILINGKRLAGKANNINDNLARISASQVEKIDLIRGAASGLDVQSQGLVINITMTEGASTSTTFWQIKGEYSLGHNFVPEFLLSHSGSAGNLEYTFSAERNNNDFYYDNFESFFDPADSEFAKQTIGGNFNRKGYKLNSNVSYSFEDGSRARLNGLYEPSGNTGLEIRSKTTNILDPVEWLTERNFGKWEVGGDYSRSLGFLGNLKTLFVVNNNTEDGLVNRFKGTGDQKFEYTMDITNVKRTEKIFRASLTKSLTQRQSIEIGGEGAFNHFDKRFDSSNRDIANDPLMINNSDNVKIKENRFEIFATHSYNISDKMVLQSSLTAEFSKIVADNIFADGSVSRRDTSFTYLKPRINFRYDLTDRDQFRILVEKKVSQLNFNNFVTRFDQQEQIFKFGNTNIRPEQTWDYSVAYEHRLPNDSGSIEGEIFYRSYKDHISTVDFSEYQDFSNNPISGTEFFALPPDMALRDAISFSAKSGNIDKATAYGVKLKTNIRLGFIGVPTATFSFGYVFEKRRTIDQFTNLTRGFDRMSDHSFNFNFRHNITKYKFTYGFEGDFRSDAASYYINYYWPDSPAANLKLFAEKSIFGGLKLHFEAEGITKNRGSSTYYVYNDHIKLNDLKERQEKIGRRPVELRVSLQGTF